MSSKQKPELQLLPSYLAAIKNSVGSNLFRNEFYLIDGKSIDVLDDGDLSCATYVTGILYLFNLISERHTTVIETLKDLSASGWYELKRPRPGAVIHWGFMKRDDGTQGTHHHVGFWLDPDTAVSNDSGTRVIWKHHPTYGMLPNGEAKRDILAYYWHKKLV